MNADGFSFSVMVGIAETYLPAFVLARGLGALPAAMIATVPVLLGSLLQLLAPFLLQKLRSYRLFVVLMATIQACSMLVLMGMAFLEYFPTWTVFVPATLYWAAGLATGPAWNTWVEQLVPEQIRSGFFARRSRLCQVGVLLGLISGGLLLRWSVVNELTVPVFAILFGVGAVGRFISAGMLARHTEVLHSVRRTAFTAEDIAINRVSAREKLAAVFRTVRHPGTAGRLIFFLMAVQTAAQVAGPYFSPFMLKELSFSWVDYMGLLSLGFVGKMLSLPWAGRFANRFGADRLLWVGSLGIVPISAMWFVSQNIWFLGFVQILSGLVWGCYELAMLLQFFRQIPGDRRMAVLTVYNLGNSAAMVAGTLIGALILNGLGRTYGAYLTVFAASSLFRMTALLALPGRRNAVRTTQGAVKIWIQAAPLRGIIVQAGRVAGRSAFSNAQHSGRTNSESATSLPGTAASQDSSGSSKGVEAGMNGGSRGNRRRDDQSSTRMPARVDEKVFQAVAPSE